MDCLRPAVGLQPTLLSLVDARVCQTHETPTTCNDQSRRQTPWRRFLRQRSQMRYLFAWLHDGHRHKPLDEQLTRSNEGQLIGHVSQVQYQPLPFWRPLSLFLITKLFPPVHLMSAKKDGDCQSQRYQNALAALAAATEAECLSPSTKETNQRRSGKSHLVCAFCLHM